MLENICVNSLLWLEFEYDSHLLRHRLVQRKVEDKIHLAQWEAAE